MALRFSGRLRRISRTPSALEVSSGSLMRRSLPQRLPRRRPGPGAEVDIAVGREPHERRPCGDVLVELRPVDLVERVVGRVMDLEVAARVLAERKGGNSRPTTRSTRSTGR